MQRRVLTSFILMSLAASSVRAQSGRIAGSVRDDSGGPLPGASIELRANSRAPQEVISDGNGGFIFDRVPAGQYELVCRLINFAPARRDVVVGTSGTPRVDVVLHFALNADVTVTAKHTFTNLADVENPAEDLVGIAQAASQGAIMAKQLDERPLMRDGEVLETVPGVIVTQHSGEGKANQYFLRGFNLDHGTDFASVVAGIPVNLPTHAHGQGYSDLNFLIPELVTGVQFSKGPYYADQGDFAMAG
jgi:carboxypeptidase family protein/TonB-dependent receptor-like protein